MSEKPKMAGGFLIVIGILAGVFVGVRYNAPVPGGIGGLVVGGAAAIILWLIDRKKG